MTFIIHYKNGRREVYVNHYDGNDEHERDSAWEDVHDIYPNADYIEEY